MKYMAVFFLVVNLTAGFLYTQQGSRKKSHTEVTVGNGGSGNRDFRPRVTVGSAPQEKPRYPTWRANRDCWGWSPLLDTEVIDPQQRQEEEFRRWQEQANEARRHSVDQEKGEDVSGNSCKKSDRKVDNSMEKAHERDWQRIKENERLIEGLNRWIHSLCVFGLPGYEKEVEQIKERIRSLRRINEKLQQRLYK